MAPYQAETPSQAFFHDRSRHVQPETGTAAIFLGSEIGVKYPRGDVRRYAAAVIADIDRYDFVFVDGYQYADTPLLRLALNVAAFQYGVAGISKQV